MILESSGWQVEIEERGRSGNVDYSETAGCIRLFWEFGGGDVIAIISGPPSEEWERKYPWARGRVREILSRVAGEIVRLRAPSCRFELDEARATILILPG
jgi:hypothetical protein